MKFNKDKYKVLPVGGRAPGNNTGRGLAGRQLCREVPGGSGRQQAGHGPAMCPGTKQTNSLLGQTEAETGDPRR